MTNTPHSPLHEAWRWFDDHVVSLVRDWRERAHYASNDPETLKRRTILIERSIAGNVGLTVSGVTPIENMIKGGRFNPRQVLEEPGQTLYGIGVDDNRYLKQALYKMVANPIFATTLADWCNSYCMDWNNHRDRVGAVEALGVLADGQERAARLDDGALRRQLATLRRGTIAALFSGGDEADTLLRARQDGTAILSPDDALALSRHLALRATLLREMADFRESGTTPGTLPPLTPEAILEDIDTTIARGEARNAREAQLVIAAAAALLSDGIPTIGRLEFIPFEERALTAEDIRRLSDSVIEHRDDFRSDSPERLLRAASMVCTLMRDELDIAHDRRITFLRQDIDRLDGILEASHAR